MTFHGHQPPPLASCSPHSSPSSTMIDPQWTPDSCASASSNEVPCGFAPPASAPKDAALPQGLPGGTADTFTAVCVVPFAAPLHAASRQPLGLPSPGKNGPLAPFTISVVPQTAASPRAHGAAQPAAASDVLPLWVGPLHVLDVSTHAARVAGESYAVRPLFALLVSSDASTGGGATPCGEQEDADRAPGPAERPLIVAAAAADDEWTAMAEAWKGGEGCGAEAEGGCEWDQVAADVKAQAQQLLRDCGLTGVALTIPGSARHRHERARQIIAAAHHQWCSLSPAPLPPPPSARLPFPNRAAHPPAVSPRSPLTPCPENGSDGSSKADGWEGFKSGNAQGRSGMSGRAARTLLLAACCAGLDARHLRTHSLAADPLDSAAADQPSPLSAVPPALPSPCAVSPPPVLQAPGSFRRQPGCSIEVPPSPAAEPERASPGRRLRKLLSPVYSLGGSWFAVPRLSSAAAPPLASSASPMTNRGCAGRESGAEMRGRDENWGNEDRENKEGGEEERREREEGGDGGEAQLSARGKEKGERDEGESEEEEEEEEREGGREREGQDGRELARSQTMRSLQRSASRRGQAGGVKGAGQRRARAAARAEKGGAKVSAGLAMARSTSFRVYIETGKGPAGGKGRQEDGGEGGRLSRQNSSVGRKPAQEERGVRYVRQASQRERGGEAQGRGDENEGRRDQNGGAGVGEEEEPGSFRRAYSAPNRERSLERSKSMRRAQEGDETDAGNGRREDNAGGAVSGAEAGAGVRVRGSERGEERSGDRRGRDEQGELQRSRTLPSKPARSGGGREQAAEKGEAEWDSEAQREAERAEMEERAERLRRQLQQQKQRLQRQSSGQQQAARSGTDEQAAGLAKRGKELLRLASLPRQQQLDAQGAPAQAGGARRGAKQAVSGATPRLRRTGRDGSFRVYLDLSPRSPPARAAAAAEDNASATQGMRRAATHSGASEQTRAGDGGGVAASERQLDRAASMHEGGMQAQAGRQAQMRRAVTHTGAAEERVMEESGAGAAERRKAEGSSSMVRRAEAEGRAEEGEGRAEALRKGAGVVSGERERLAAAAAAARRRVLVIDIPDKGDLYPAPLTAPACTLDPSPTAAATPPIAAPSSARAAPRAAPSGQAGSRAFPGGSRQRAVAGGQERRAGKAAVAGTSPTSANVMPTAALFTPTSPMITPTSAVVTPTSAVITPSSRGSNKPSPRPATLHAPGGPAPSPARALLVPPSLTAPSGPPAAAPPPRIQPARSLPPIREGVALQGLLHASQRAARGPAFPPSASAPLGDERMGAWVGAGGGQEEVGMQWQGEQAQVGQRQQWQQQGVRVQQGWEQEAVGGGEQGWEQWAVVQPHAQLQQQGELSYYPDPHDQLYRHQQQQQQFYQPNQQAGFNSQRWQQQQQMHAQQRVGVERQEWSEMQSPQPSLAHSHSFNPQPHPQQRQQQQWQQQQQGEWLQQGQPKRVSFRQGDEPASHLVSQQLPRVGATPHHAPPQQQASNMRVAAHSQQRPLHGPQAASARAQSVVTASSPRGGDASLTRLLSWNASSNSFAAAVHA